MHFIIKQMFLVPIAVLSSLLLVSNYFGYELFDVIIGSLIAVYIIYSAYELIHGGIMVLLDRALDEEMVINIISIITKYKDVHSFHHLKTREAANKIFVEAHIVLQILLFL